MSDQRKEFGGDAAATQRPAMSPGDQAPAGTPGTGENTCPECGGKGQLRSQPCSNCEGTGKVIVAIDGA